MMGKLLTAERLAIFQQRAKERRTGDLDVLELLADIAARTALLAQCAAALADVYDAADAEDWQHDTVNDLGAVQDRVDNALAALRAAGIGE